MKTQLSLYVLSIVFFLNLSLDSLLSQTTYPTDILNSEVIFPNASPVPGVFGGGGGCDEPCNLISNHSFECNTTVGLFAFQNGDVEDWTDGPTPSSDIFSNGTQFGPMTLNGIPNGQNCASMISIQFFGSGNNFNGSETIATELEEPLIPGQE
ncbi:MAG: hypothetical protein AB8B53_01345 [Flavobacteriales bacterium]